MDGDSEPIDVSRVLMEIAAGKADATERLMPLVYDQLRQIAQRLLRHEAPGHTLQPTALVNECFLRLAGKNEIDWQGKTHFFAIGAKVMRRILVNHARARKTKKRGGEQCRIPLADELCVSNRNDEDVLAIEEALTKLEHLDERQAKVVELRFYGGLTVDEVAEALGVSKRTVESDWTMVRAWLRRELSGETTS